MKNFLSSVIRFSFVACLVVGGLNAVAQECEKISQKNAKLTCEAVSQSNVRLCDDIESKDNRIYCQVQVQTNSYTCEKISNAGIRFDCLSFVKKKQSNAIWSFKPSSSKP